MSLFRDLEFLTTVAALRDLPPARGPEVAFVGRSNSGKSSTINALANHRRLAFASKTPGRTRHINFFRFAQDRYLVDLPGYGFARTGAAQREDWANLIEGYIQERAALRGLVLLMDVRHPLTEMDRQLLGWFLPTGKPVHVLLNKADKLSRSEALRVLRQITAALGQAYPNCSVQIFSSRTGLGLKSAEQVIARWMGAVPKP